VRIENFHGFLFANLDPDAPDGRRWFPQCARANWRTSYRTSRGSSRWNGWRSRSLQLEGFGRELFRVLPLPLNHPTFASGVIKPETYDIQPQGHCLRHTTECRTSTG
jgi:hypothetical protein